MRALTRARARKLASLPYFLIATHPTVPEFLTRTDYALNYFVAIQRAVVAQVTTSFLNSLCLILNTGFPVPPIPCGSCQVGGFIPLSKRDATDGPGPR